MHVHIHAPSATSKRAFFRNCPDCKQRARFVAFSTPYYGSDVTCTKCGREWADGEWCDLPFIRQSRQRNIRMALDRWDRMPPVSKNHLGLE